MPLAWPDVELPGNRSATVLRDALHAHSLWQALPDQAVGVLIRASLPGAVRIGEIDRHTTRALGIGVALRYPVTMVDAALISKVKMLSVPDRLELIGAVWESLAANDAPVTDAEKALLDARLADLARNPEDQSPWPEAQERLRRLLP